MKKIFICLFTALILITCFTGSGFASTYAEGVTGSYSYNYWGESIPAPAAYKYAGVSKFEESIIGALDGAADMFVYNGEIFLLDNGNNRIVVADDKLNAVR